MKFALCLKACASRFFTALLALCAYQVSIRATPDAPASSRAAPTDLCDVKPSANDWPWWRGPTRDNISPETQPPVRWGTNSNVRWKTYISGRGHASPTIWSNRIFIATGDEEAQIQSVLALDRQSGKRLWTTEVHRGGFLIKHENNSHASATPACDGKHVFFPSLFDDALWVTALDLNGRLVWQRRIGRFISSNGYGSSPVLYKSMVIVVSDNAGDACLTALHRRTGEVLWSMDRPKLDNFCTPTLGRVAGRMQLLVSGSRMLAGYDPDTGHQLWFCESPTEVTACTMAFGGNLVVGGGNVPVREFMCVRADGTGNITKTHIAWRSAKNVSYVPSPLIKDKRLYFVNDSGIAHCLELTTGREIWKERLGGDFFASPVLADGKLYFTNKGGTTYIVRASDKFEILAQNDLKEECFASPVICGHQLFIRAKNSLYCIGTDH